MIYEDNFRRNTGNDSATFETLSKLMGEERAARGQFYIDRYYNGMAALADKFDEWTTIEKLYKCQRFDGGDDDYSPDSFIPLITPVIEGQTASIVEPNMALYIRGAGPDDAEWAKMLQHGSDYMRKRDNFKAKFKDAVRSYGLFGEAFWYLYWDASDYDGRGSGKRKNITLSDVIVDPRIKDPSEIDEADYIIIRVGDQTLEWARREYGDEIANIVAQINAEDYFDGQPNYNDDDTFTLLHVWTKNNEKRNLQLIEMDMNGVVLRESDSSAPYYKYVGNQYPVVYTRAYAVQDSFHGFGDGRLLAHMQVMVNRLIDEQITACKFNAQPQKLFDPNSRFDPDEATNDPSEWIACNNPNQNIRVIEGRGLSPVVMNTVGFLLQQAQRATRFSDVMMGMPIGRGASATEAATIANTGSTGIMDKRSDLGNMVSKAERYLLGLALEFWDDPFWVQLSDSDSYEMLEFHKLREIPAMIPTTNEYRLKWMKDNPTIAPPKYIYAEGDDGQVKKCVEFDVDVSLGEGLPTSKLYVYNMLLSLAQLMVVDEATGQPRPMVGYNTAKKMLEQLVGINLDAFKDEENAALMQAGAMGGGVNPPSGSNINAPMGTQISMPPENLASTPGASRRGAKPLVGGPF